MKSTPKKKKRKKKLWNKIGRTSASSFRDRVYQVVAAIPRGETMTYREVAKQAGSPNAVRAVGTLMKKNTNPDVPCHRVVRSDGTIGEYNRGKTEKKRLKNENICIDANLRIRACRQAGEYDE